MQYSLQPYVVPRLEQISLMAVFSLKLNRMRQSQRKQINTRSILLIVFSGLKGINRIQYSKSVKIMYVPFCNKKA